MLGRMNTAADSALVARWRRLNDAVATVRTAVEDADEHRCPDAVAVALDAMYELWEYWSGKRTAAAGQFTLKDEDAFVKGQPEGEVTAALIHARGAKTHKHVEFGDFTNTYGATYHQHYGAWRWQQFASTDARYATRHGWYEQHVADGEVMPVFDAAVSWLKSQPELAT